jgi:hypothetical protein
LVIVGKLRFVDLGHRRLNVYCAGDKKVVVDVPEGSRICINGHESYTLRIFHGLPWSADAHNVTIRRLPGGSGKLDIVVKSKLKFWPMSDEEYRRLTGTPP